MMFFFEVFITIVLLLSWTDFYKGQDDIDVIDSFAGAARIARVSRSLGYKAVALDRDYHKNPRVFDFNESAGFALLVQILVMKIQFWLEPNCPFQDII